MVFTLLFYFLHGRPLAFFLLFLSSNSFCWLMKHCLLSMWFSFLGTPYFTLSNEPRMWNSGSLLNLVWPISLIMLSISAQSNAFLGSYFHWTFGLGEQTMKYVLQDCPEYCELRRKYWPTVVTLILPRVEAEAWTAWSGEKESFHCSLPACRRQWLNVGFALG